MLGATVRQVFGGQDMLQIISKELLASLTQICGVVKGFASAEGGVVWCGRYGVGICVGADGAALGGPHFLMAVSGRTTR